MNNTDRTPVVEADDGLFVPDLPVSDASEQAPDPAAEHAAAPTDGQQPAREKKEKQPLIRIGKHYRRRGVFTTLYLCKIAVLTAFAVVLLLIEFPIFPATPWLKLNVSDLPGLLAACMFGPLSGMLVSSLRVGLGLLIRGTSTMYVGDLSNLIGGIFYTLAVGLFYRAWRSRLGALFGLIVGSVAFIAVMWLSNGLFLLPMFGITDRTVIVGFLWWTLLFNLIKCVVTSALTFLLYKATRKLFSAF